MKFSYLVLGCGRVGRAVCLSLKKKNKNVYLWDRDFNKTIKFCKKYKINFIKNLREFKGNFLIFAIKDDSLRNMAERASREIKTKGVAIHTSGIYNEEILNPLKEKGWILGKCHPIFSFSNKEKEIPSGLTYGVQGEKKVIKEIKRFLSIFKGKILVIEKGKEEIYHLCLSLASNFPAFFFYISQDIFEKNFGKKEALKPLFFKTLENVIKYGKGGITGPHIRKDKKTIKKHKKIIQEKFPDLKNLYNVLSKEIMKINL